MLSCLAFFFFPGSTEALLSDFISAIRRRIIVARLSASPKPQTRLSRAVTAAADISTFMSAFRKVFELTCPYDRIKNLHIASAAAEIARQTAANICFSGIGISFEQIHGSLSLA